MECNRLTDPLKWVIINNGGKAGSPSNRPLAERGEGRGVPARLKILAWISADKPQSEGGAERLRCLLNGEVS